MANQKLVCCGQICCGCLIFLPWFGLVLISVISGAGHQKYCQSGVDFAEVAADARPEVYGTDGTISWESVSSGWNTACGDIPSNFSNEAAKYASHTGGRAFVTDDSAFKRNAWSETDSDFQLYKVQDAEEVTGFPFGSQAQMVQTISRIWQINAFWMPTATLEVMGFMTLEFEICAYFQSADVPDMRIIKSTVGPGAAEPGVQHFITVTEDDLFQYDYVSPIFNDDWKDDSDPVGKGRFSSKAGDGCSIWSEANGAIPFVAFIVILSLILVAYIGLLVYLRCKAKSAAAS